MVRRSTGTLRGGGVLVMGGGLSILGEVCYSGYIEEEEEEEEEQEEEG